MKSRLDEAIERLEEADDWEDTSVTVMLESPPQAPRSTYARAVGLLDRLPPWGRVFILALALVVIWGSGLANRVLDLLAGAF